MLVKIDSRFSGKNRWGIVCKPASRENYCANSSIIARNCLDFVKSMHLLAEGQKKIRVKYRQKLDIKLWIFYTRGIGFGKPKNCINWEYKEGKSRHFAGQICKMQEGSQKNWPKLLRKHFQLQEFKNFTSFVSNLQIILSVYFMRINHNWKRLRFVQYFTKFKIKYER